MGLIALLATTYCIVSGGPYGLEDVVGKSGYTGALIILLVTPLIWSIPTGLMVSELASALPMEGGYYLWVTRAMGRFWGFQEAWLSLLGSIFDMAIYPALFSWYLARLWPSLGVGYLPIVLGTGMIAVCVGWNLFSARVVGRWTVAIAVLILCPFAVLIALALGHAGAPAQPPVGLGHLDLMGGIMITMWNYTGWDNISTVAGEVENPRRNYPLTMFLAVPIVTLIYIIPIWLMSRTGIDFRLWATGGWVDIARVFGGTALATGMMLGGAISNVGTFNTLVLSLTRLPAVMAEDGYLPRIFAYRNPRTMVPVVSLLVCAVMWAAFQGLGFLKVVIFDVLLSGANVLLEFFALIILRIREPGLARPYRVPGGIWGPIAIMVGPLALILMAIRRTAEEKVANMNGLAFSAILVAVGCVIYWISSRTARRKRS
jgi:amino acid transporter